MRPRRLRGDKGRVRSSSGPRDRLHRDSREHVLPVPGSGRERSTSGWLGARLVRESLGCEPRLRGVSSEPHWPREGERAAPQPSGPGSISAAPWPLPRAAAPPHPPHSPPARSPTAQFPVLMPSYQETMTRQENTGSEMRPASRRRGTGGKRANEMFFCHCRVTAPKQRGETVGRASWAGQSAERWPQQNRRSLPVGRQTLGRASVPTHGTQQPRGSWGPK